ncbi:MAG: hypothetical protein ACK5OH_00165, partial [bacterium]
KVHPSSKPFRGQNRFQINLPPHWDDAKTSGLENGLWLEESPGIQILHGRWAHCIRAIPNNPEGFFR